MAAPNITKPIVLLTGGGTGGHLYPLLAVADELHARMHGELMLVYVGPATPFDDEFAQRNIHTYRIASSKFRRYIALENILDIPRFVWSLVKSFAILYAVMPSVVFSKGGPGALPVVIASWFYRVPVVIHESDAIPGLTNRLSAPFAKRIAVSFKTAAPFFAEKKTALVGVPLRKELTDPSGDNEIAKRSLGFAARPPLMFVIGGSQGSTRLNGFIVANLHLLLREFQIYHQTGSANVADARTQGVHTIERLPDELRTRYHIAGTLTAAAMRTALIAADIVLSRAGASAIYEIAASKKPALLVPLPEAASNHQFQNAAEYAALGTAAVIDEANLSPAIVIAEAKRLCGDVGARASATGITEFRRPQAASTIVTELLRIAAVS